MQQGNLGAQGMYNQANLGAQGLNQQTAMGNQQMSGNIVGGILGGLGSAAGMPKAHGGLIHNYAEGGYTVGGASSGPSSAAGKFLSGFGSNMNTESKKNPMNSGFAQFGKGMGNLINPTAQPLKLSDTTMPVTPMSPQMEAMAMPMAAYGGALNFKPGGPVPGKAKVSGDSLKNDTVPAMVSPGEIVLPRTVTQSEDAPRKAADFVAAILARENIKKRKK
jgi:hypothetical protein